MSKGTGASHIESGEYSVTIEPDGPTGNVWCADRTEDISGNVGIIDVAGVRGTGFNIQPGHEGNAVYDSDRDGGLQNANDTPAPETYFDFAMQGGWQKWKPNYRYGVISNIDTDADTGDVALDAVANPDTGLSVNQSDSLSSVTIDYMDCDSAAFADGDRVIVKFENNDWDSPKVIGFESEPKPCGLYLVIGADSLGEQSTGVQIIIWDINNDKLAEADDDSGNPMVFPIALLDTRQFFNDKSIFFRDEIFQR